MKVPKDSVVCLVQNVGLGTSTYGCGKEAGPRGVEESPSLEDSNLRADFGFQERYRFSGGKQKEQQRRYESECI